MTIGLKLTGKPRLVSWLGLLAYQVRSSSRGLVPPDPVSLPFDQTLRS